ncbi:MAG: sensor histidine kinase [Chloroflexi bacterium]|nr:sensor histidine kinase [Chloroflexota bacterium]
MFSSLRARLWLSYMLVGGAVLAAITFALLVFLVRNPRVAREAEINLISAANTIQRQRLNLGGETNLEEIVQSADELLDVRVLILNSQGDLLADSRADSAGALPELRLASGPGPLAEVAEFTDASGQEWLYTHRMLQGRVRLLLATPRPAVPVLAVFTDEFFAPIARAALLALALSLLFSFLVARWIASPLQGISQASRGVAEGQLTEIQPNGPREVQSLARAFNEMSHQVHTSRQSQRDFVANVSHELKTPLTSVQGFAQAILDGTVQGGEGLKQAAQVIFNEAGRMHRMVVELLDLASLDAGTAPLNRVTVDMGQLLREVRARFVPQAELAGVRIVSQIDNLPKVVGDQDRLTQVFNNLVENALKFSPKGGEVNISAQQGNGALLVTVRDSGPGIPAEEVDRIFERFFQVDKARSGGRPRGAGLGLSIAQKIVNAHGGELRVESQPGQGSRFIVRLPLDGAPA